MLCVHVYILAMRPLHPPAVCNMKKKKIEFITSCIWYPCVHLCQHNRCPSCTSLYFYGLLPSSKWRCLKTFVQVSLGCCHFSVLPSGAVAEYCPELKYMALSCSLIYHPNGNTPAFLYIPEDCGGLFFILIKWFHLYMYNSTHWMLYFRDLYYV